MEKRKWKSSEKLQIVLEGIKGQTTIAELCNRHQISQAQYYQWRDRLLEQGSKVFEPGGGERQEERLKREVNRLKQTIGELHVELKKSEGDWL